MPIIDFRPARFDIALYNRDDQVFHIQPLDINDVVVNLTGATAIAEIQNTLGQEIGTLDVSINETDNVIVIDVPKSKYSTWTWTQGVYDLQLTLGSGQVVTILRGDITIQGDISHA